MSKKILALFFFFALNLHSSFASANFFDFLNGSNDTGNNKYGVSTYSIDSAAKAFAKKADNLNSGVVKLAIQAYFNAQKKGVNVAKPILTVVDYSLPSSTKRLWVLDLVNNRVLFSSLVAHGKYSGDTYTTSFSNQSGSKQSSIGLYLTENTYIGHRGYTLRVKGLDYGFNDKAESRHIVLHGAWYVTEDLARLRGTIGRSFGCFAVEPNLLSPIVETVKNGSLIFAYYPNHNWLANSKYLHYNA